MNTKTYNTIYKTDINEFGIFPEDLNYEYESNETTSDWQKYDQKFVKIVLWQDLI